MKKIPARPAHHAGDPVGNIQAIAAPSLESGEMAVVHLDKSGEVVVDGKIIVP